MQHKDRVKETSTTTGTGALTLLGAVAQFVSFATVYGATTTYGVRFYIVGQTGTEWECAEGDFNGTTGLTRTRVIASSNAGALVSFSAGTKDVFIDAASEDLSASDIGRSLALAAGWAMP